LHTELAIRARNARGAQLATIHPRGMLFPWSLLSVRTEYFTSNTGGDLVEQTMQATDPIAALYPYMLSGPLGVQSDTGFHRKPGLPANGDERRRERHDGRRSRRRVRSDLRSNCHRLASPRRLKWGRNVDGCFRQQSPPGEMMVRADLARSMAVAIDALVFNGTGSSGQPTGLLNVAGTNAVSGTSANFATLCSASQAVLDANGLVNPRAAGWATCPDVAALLAQRYESSALVNRLWQGSLRSGRVLGDLALSSKQLPAATLAYGDFSQIVIPFYGEGIELMVNPFDDSTGTGFESGNVTWRAFATIDVVIRHAASFSIISSIT
jgi:hypothetical protein